MGLLGLLEVYAHGVARFVDVEAHLHAVEVDGATGKASSTHLLGKAVQQEQFVGIFIARQGLFGAALLALYDGLHLLVSIPPVATDDGVGYLMILHAPLVINMEKHGIGKLVFVGAERADVVAQALGKHGDGAVDEIYRGGAVLCLLVDDAVLAYVVGDVGNVYAHLPEVLAEGTDGEGIVKVLGIVGVDGEGKHVAHVDAAGYLVGRDDVADVVGGILHGKRILVGKSKLGEDGVHLHVVVASFTKDVHYLTYGVAGSLGPLYNLHYGLVAALAALELVARDEDVIVERAALGEQEGIVALHLEDTYESIVGPLEDLHHLAFGHAAATAAGKEAHAHAVAMQGVHRVTLGNVYRLLVLLGGEEDAAAASALDGAYEFAPLEHKTEVPVLGFHNAAVDEHVTDDVTAEHLLRMRGEA